MGIIEQGQIPDYRLQMQKALIRDMGGLFDSYANSQDRINRLLIRLDTLLRLFAADIDRGLIEEGLNNCRTITDRNEFITQIGSALKPLIDFMGKNPEESEAKQRVAFMEDGQFIRLNEIICYELCDDGWIHVHLAPCRTMAAEQRDICMEDAIEQLKEVAKKNIKIKGLVAKSWIVAKKPKYVTKFGFSIDGPVEGDSSTISLAHLDRVDLLKK